MTTSPQLIPLADYLDQIVFGSKGRPKNLFSESVPGPDECDDWARRMAPEMEELHEKEEKAWQHFCKDAAEGKIRVKAKYYGSVLNGEQRALDWYPQYSNPTEPLFVPAEFFLDDIRFSHSDPYPIYYPNDPKLSIFHAPWRRPMVEVVSAIEPIMISHHPASDEAELFSSQIERLIDGLKPNATARRDIFRALAATFPDGEMSDQLQVVTRHLKPFYEKLRIPPPSLKTVGRALKDLRGHMKASTK